GTSVVLAARRASAETMAVVAQPGIAAGLLHSATIRMDDMAAGAARVAVVARIVVRSEEPHVRIVEPRLQDVEDRNRHPQPGRGAAVRLLQIRTSRLVEKLNLAGRVRVADLGEQRLDGS